MITRDPFKLRSPNLDQRYKTTWLCISLSKSPHSNYINVQFLPFNSLRLRDGWLFTDDIFQCIFGWKFLNLDRNLLTFIAKGPIDHWVLGDQTYDCVTVMGKIELSEAGVGRAQSPRPLFIWLHELHRYYTQWQLRWFIATRNRRTGKDMKYWTWPGVHFTTELYTM